MHSDELWIQVGARRPRDCTWEAAGTRPRPTRASSRWALGGHQASDASNPVQVLVRRYLAAYLRPQRLRAGHLRRLPRFTFDDWKLAEG